MEFRLGVYTDVTKFAQELNPEYNNYEKIYLCPDIKNIWLIRVQKDWNEEYEREIGTYLIERDNPEYIDMERSKSLASVNPKLFATRVLAEDQFENWDVYECFNMDEVIDVVDGGIGIIAEGA